MNCFKFVVSLIAYSAIMTIVVNAIAAGPVVTALLTVVGIVGGAWLGNKLLNHEN